MTTDFIKRIPTLGVYTASAIVIANMIGSGVFGSIGHQVNPAEGGIQSVFPILCLWIVGGIISFCGALSYAELGTALPRNGGEYNFLREIYHPILGFVSGWVSLVAGFAAPIAGVSLLFGDYFTKLLINVSEVTRAEYSIRSAVAIIILVSIIHTVNTALGSGFQRVMTFLKVAVIILFILSGLFGIFNNPSFSISVLPKTGDFSYIFSGGFASSLVFVMYAYSGWNASSYLSAEIKDPGKNLPKSILIGTLVVTLLYLLLNYVFLYTVPMSEMTHWVDGKLVPYNEIGHLSATKIFGVNGGIIMSGVIAFLLISTISSMIFAGPRVLQTMGEDTKMLNFLSLKSISNIPYVALWFQSIIAIAFVVTGKFETIINYVGFTLQLITFLAVLGVIILRIQKPNLARPFKTWGYPIVPIVFLLLTMWALVFFFLRDPTVALVGIGTLVVGALIYYLDIKFFKEEVNL